MRTIIAGSRSITDYKVVESAVVASQFEITEVVSGGAKGVDILGEEYARQNNIPVKKFLPDWKKHGRKAGILRNCEMGDYAEALVAIWDGKSSGTKHMIDYSQKKNLKVYVYYV